MVHGIVDGQSRKNECEVGLHRDSSAQLASKSRQPLAGDTIMSGNFVVRAEKWFYLIDWP